GDDQPDRADEFEDAEGRPGLPRQRAKGRDVVAYLVEHEDLHDARRSVHERGEDLQDPQQYVHVLLLVTYRKLRMSASRLQKSKSQSGDRIVRVKREK